MSSIPREIGQKSEILADELLALLLTLASARPSFDGSPADVAIREALAVLASFRGRPSLGDGAVEDLGAARALLERALGTLGGDEEERESLSDALAFLGELRTRAIDRMIEDDRQGVARAAVAAPDEFLLSLGTPTLHRGLPIAVPRLLASEDDDPIVEPSDDGGDDLDAFAEDEPAPAPAAPPLLALAPPPVEQGDPDERRQAEAHARDAMEDLAAFASLRRLSDDEPWSDADGFEQRLLASFDALLSLARPLDPGSPRLDLAGALFRYATEWAVPDRGRTFAFAFTLSCVTPDAALLWVTMALRRADPRVHEAYIEALSLGANPHIDDTIINLLPADTPRELVLLALEVARRRRVFDPGMMLPLLWQPDAAIAAATARCLPHAPEAMRAEILSACTTDARPALRIAAATALVQLGTPSAFEILADALARAIDAHDQAAILAGLRGLAIGGYPPAADVVWAGAQALGTYREVGFFGHIGHVDRLFAVLAEHGRAIDPAALTSGDGSRVDQADSAARAIRRISGIAPPRLASGRYDLDAFRAAWIKRAPGLPLGRLRFGESIDRRQIVRELAAKSSVQADRRLLAEELALHSQGKLRFDVDGWLADQRAFLAMAAEAWPD